MCRHVWAVGIGLLLLAGGCRQRAAPPASGGSAPLPAWSGVHFGVRWWAAGGDGGTVEHNGLVRGVPARLEELQLGGLSGFSMLGWSGDGSRLALYVYLQSAGAGAVWAADTETGTPRPLATGARFRSWPPWFAWAPRGAGWAVVDNRGQLFVGDARRSTSHALGAVPIAERGHEWYPAWSDDGQHLAWLGRGGRVRWYDLEGRGRTVSTSLAAYSIEWAPGGRCLLTTGPGKHKTLRSIGIVSVATGKQVVVTDEGSLVRWSPDGTLLGVVTRQWPSYAQSGPPPSFPTPPVAMIFGEDGSEKRLAPLDLSTTDMGWAPAGPPTLVGGGRPGFWYLPASPPGPSGGLTLDPKLTPLGWRFWASWYCRPGGPGLGPPSSRPVESLALPAATGRSAGELIAGPFSPNGQRALLVRYGPVPKLGTPPGGEPITVSGSRELHVFDFGTGQCRPLPLEVDDKGKQPASLLFHGPIWSPDGRFVALNYDIHEAKLRRGSAVVDVETGRLTPIPDKDGCAQFIEGPRPLGGASALTSAGRG
jgi:WD40-like Beta Propeller Repeat